jgi:urea transport system permease protein
MSHRGGPVRGALAFVFNLILTCGIAVLGTTLPGAAALPDLEPLLRGLGSPDFETVQKSVVALGDRADPAALPALEALYDDRLQVGPDGVIYIKVDRTTLIQGLTGAPVTSPPARLRGGEMNNEIRRVILPIIARLKLSAADPALRLQAADELAKRGGEQSTLLLRQALARETNAKVKASLSLALARGDIADPVAEKRLAALVVMKEYGNGSNRPEIEAVNRKKPDGQFVEPDPRVRAAASAALGAIARRETLTSMAGHVLYGLSLSSVFLFAALGLAITFGVMGVINMAHGEMLTIGAYTTFVVQTVLSQSAPALLPYYLLLSIPAAFVVAGAVGVILERTVIRWLYGRPLETLLATWGISLFLVQGIRLIFGASNVAVSNPSWLSGGFEPFSGLVLSYNRIAVVLFVALAALFVWFLLQRTTLGLQVRAVTQNRAMAACMGIRTSRVDMWTFGLGSGIAGLGGVALSQIGNVGPELGQTYILDSFMVVVLGGVGRIAGTIFAALGLGIAQKLIEPVSGAVLGKIAVLVFIILYIQRRPQGMFALKGRVEA